jgi:hypothetical protein
MTSLPNLPDIFKDLVSSINIDNTLNKCNKKCSKRKKYGNAYSTLRKTKRMNKWYNL